MTRNLLALLLGFTLMIVMTGTAAVVVGLASWMAFNDEVVR